MFREDLRARSIGSGFHGFSVSFPVSDGAVYDASEFSARVLGTSFTIPNIAISRANNILPRLIHRGSRLVQRVGRNKAAISGSVTGPHRHYGKIASISGSCIDVWVQATATDFVPVVIVGGKPAWQATEAVKLDGQPEDATGFRFFVSGIRAGAEISLWLVLEGRVELCETRLAAEDSFERAILTQMTEAARIARQPGAVAVTCWDGAHNPVGRAKVLYDIVKQNRPVVLFCFLFNDFGNDIWSPLRATNDHIVTIPWADRYFYFQLAQSMGIQFDTVWMCKPRGPTFELTSNLALPTARLILDFDDNEEHFSRSFASRAKAYGLLSISLSRHLMNSIPARTAASLSLARDFGAELVRHARHAIAPQGNLTRRPRRIQIRHGSMRKRVPVKLGFIGTVRPHKRILEAACQVRQLNEQSRLDVEFHVYGDIQPDAHRAALIAEGVTVKQNIPAGRLAEYLSGMDVILSGFPSDAETDKPITKYQISAKIGDALSVGKPVMVPESPSVEDLRETPGVYLFTSNTFAQQLAAAVRRNRKTEIALPESYSMEAAYSGFTAAEAKAEKTMRGAGLHALVPRYECGFRTENRPTLLLFWKQHDAGLYGRRVDQIARAYRKSHPDHRIVVLEAVYPDFVELYREDTSRPSEFAFIRELNIRKKETGLHSEEGIEYHQLRVEKSEMLNRSVLEFLYSNTLLPTNTVIVLFPNILHLDRIFDILFPYPLIADVVDNQTSWASGKTKQMVMRQYFILCRFVDRVIFNSEPNQAFFKRHGFLPVAADKSAIIKNWYQLPDDVVFKNQVPLSEKGEPTFDIFYSGNMNDRIDWDLMARIATLHGDIRLHLIGEARRAQEQILGLLEHESVIFHGPMTEAMTLRLLAQANLTVMPHVVDTVSSFMNPLKVHMYEALKLRTIATDIPGIEESPFLKICSSQDSFINEIWQHVMNRDSAEKPGPLLDERSDTLPTSASAYVTLIDDLRARGLPERD